MGAPTSVLLAADSFKGTASSLQIEKWLAKGLLDMDASCNITMVPIADGGEGTVEALVRGCGGDIRNVTVRGPLGNPCTARYGVLPDGSAVIEMAEASGITLCDQTPENAVSASTYGVGELMLDALDSGCRKILVGLGGSATSDGGAGMAKALGVRFLDGDEQEILCGIAGFDQLARIDCSEIDPRLEEAEIVALTDVRNPLTGPAGAIAVYGPQKGVQDGQLAYLDELMSRYAAQLYSATGRDVAERAGAGAAGGLGAALMAFCDARVESGIEYVLDTVGLEGLMRDADLVITGEGRIDAQSANGKAPVGVARRAKMHGVPVVAVVGSRRGSLDPVYAEGIDLVIDTVFHLDVGFDEWNQHAEECIARGARDAYRAFALGA